MRKAKASGPRFLVYYPVGPTDKSGGTATILRDLASIARNPYFTHVVIGQGHFSSSANQDGPAGTLYWNDTPLSQVDGSVWQAVQTIGSTKTVCLQLGSGGNGTWPWISQNVQQACSNIVSALATYPIDGIDLDPEPTPTADTVRDLTTALGARKASGGFLISQCPVPWAGYFAALYGSNDWPAMAPYLDWVMPQWYGDTRAQTYQDFVSGKTTGQAIPATSVLTGQNIVGLQESSLTGLLSNLASALPGGWGGVGVWDYTTLPNGWDRAIHLSLS